MSVAVVLNPSSGPDRKGLDREALSAAFERAGVDPHVFSLAEYPDAAAAVRAALDAGCNTVAAAGGDGTVTSVATALIGAGAALGVIPCGTLNHFARDNGIPVDLDEAVQVIAAGHVTSVDVGEVNGRFFLNNSSIGFYPMMVSRREGLMARGFPKHVATAMALVNAVTRFPNLAVSVYAEGATVVTRTPLVFIGNNEYTLSGFRAGAREGLQSGMMQVCIAHTRSRAALLRVALQTLLGSVPPEDLEVLQVERIRVRTMRSRIRAALDGELVPMRSPLDYTIRPRALNVLTPKNGGSSSAG